MSAAPTIHRMFVNQPSTLQPHHALHGTRVRAHRETEAVCRVYFLAGPIISQQLPSLSLSMGWPE